MKVEDNTIIRDFALLSRYVPRLTSYQPILHCHCVEVQRMILVDIPTFSNFSLWRSPACYCTPSKASSSLASPVQFHDGHPNRSRWICVRALGGVHRRRWQQYCTTKHITVRVTGTAGMHAAFIRWATTTPIHFSMHIGGSAKAWFATKVHIRRGWMGPLDPESRIA